MSKNLIVKDQVEIHASKSRVWEILTNPEFIKEWDDIPENYSGGNIGPGSVIEWEGYSRLTATEFDAPNVLKLNMYLPKVELDPKQYDVNYQYKLTEQDSGTILDIEIGDFSPLPKAKEYYDASQEWIQTAKQKIKELSENG